jgi:hypothetical protein
MQSLKFKNANRAFIYVVRNINVTGANAVAYDICAYVSGNIVIPAFS